MCPRLIPNDLPDLVIDMVRQSHSVVLALILIVSAFPGQVVAAPLALDWAVPNGHHFTQTNGFPSGTSPMGFSIVDDEAAKFWTAFQARGGVARLGYPASQRFSWGGFVSQITQKAILQWHTDRGTVDFVNVFDDLAQSGKNDWLLSARSIPPPVAANYDQGLDWPKVVAHRKDLLRERPALLKAYLSVNNALDLYGLPTSPVHDAGPMYVIRLQRAVLQEWKVKQPWANPGDVTVANGGDLAKDSGAFPWRQLRPVSSPIETWPTSTYKITGVATWYGPGFAGKAMANGQIYQPSDATTTAANAFPLGSVLRITSGVTKKSIVVTVRDTGLFAYPDVTDLSPAAFSALGVPTSTGVTAVTVELVPPSPVPTPSLTPSPTTSKTQAPPAR
jgi:hypothetical protein